MWESKIQIFPERSVIDAMKQALAAVIINANSDEVVSTEL